MGLINLFAQEGIASTLLYISIIGITGMFLGKIKILKIRLGIAGVLFAGLIVGHLGANFNPEVIKFIKEFGLILFIYSIGLEVGPRFISSLRYNGLTMNALAIGIILLGFVFAIIFKYAFNLSAPVISGIMCGAVTNTPGLGAAQQAISEQMVNAGGMSQIAGMAYAVAYPFGVIGIILAMILIRLIFHISVKDEKENYKREISGLSGEPEAINMKVLNGALLGKDIAFMRKSLKGEFALSRLWRDGESIIPEENEIIKEGDKLFGVSTKNNFSELEIKVGPIEKTLNLNFSGNIAMKHVVFTNKKMAGKTIGQIGIVRRFPVNITRIYRNGTEIMAAEEDSVEFGDTLRIVGEKKVLDEVAALLGNSMEELSNPNTIPIFIGIFAGILLGSIPMAIPGLPAPAKLGLAGGPLVIALFLGYKGRIGKLNFYITPGANLFIRQLGIVLFLGCVGLSSGGKFVETISNGGYVWMMYGAAITFFPLLIIGIIARFMKFNYLSICGIIAGSMTDPPALEFANSISPVQAQSTAYATVYPLTMFLRILLAQVLVLMFL